jgi:hypothetical protein
VYPAWAQAQVRSTHGGIKNIPHPMGREDDPQSAKPITEVSTIGFQFLFLKECT